MSSSDDCRLCDCSTLLLEVPTSSFTKAQRRWRIAYASIYSVRVMLSLAKEIITKRGGQHPSVISHLLHPYVSLDIEPPSSKHWWENFLFSSFAPKLDKKRLVQTVKEKGLVSLRQLGGVEGVAAALVTNPENGIRDNDDEVTKRREIFGRNTYHKPPRKRLLYFVLDGFKDTTILIHLVCAALSLGFGIKEHKGWHEGGMTFVAAFLSVVASALSNFRQEIQFDKLSNISNNIKVEVVRGGHRQQISIFDLVVGDVVFLKIGDRIPADGLVLDGYSLRVHESSMTAGESDLVEVDTTRNPFLFSGSKVADGYGQMLVASVGMDTAWGEMMSSTTGYKNERTPLKALVDKLTSSIGKIGLVVAFNVLVVSLIRYFTGNTKDDKGQKEYTGNKTDVGDILITVVRIVVAAVNIVAVGIPEGLPSTVTLTLAYSMKRMLDDQAMVRNFFACEAIGSATIICTDKTGILTLNQMKVTQFWLGQESIEDDLADRIAPSVLELFYQGVGLNTTGSVCKPISESISEFFGSPTEKAILSWAVLLLGMDMKILKQEYSILHVKTFNSEKKRSGVLVRRKADETIHVHWKGAAEMIVGMCSEYYESNGIIRSMNEEGRSRIETIIQSMAASRLRCIAFAHKQVSREEMEHNDDGGKTNQRIKEDGLTLLGIFGLKDPCRPGIKKAVGACRSAGVGIKMITGDNIFAAKAIATECGILGPDYHAEIGEVVEGIEFRNYTPDERMEKVDKIRVMARSSPSDKLLMVQCLKKKGHVVAVTGDGANDAPALKEADIGLSMGIQGTEVAKESSDIVVLDDDFSSVVTVLSWGRCVYNNIQNFIQFRLTVNVVLLEINFIAAVSAGEVPLTTFQLLWVNLIMDTLDALALATDRPTKELMQKPPVLRTQPLITNTMWRNLLAQALYQTAILLILQFLGESIFSVSDGVNNTLIFSTFVLCQVFNEFNARKLEKQNVFKGLLKNRLFLGIAGMTIILHVVMVEFSKKLTDTEKLNLWQWGVCILLAAFSWPIAWFVKLIPVPGKQLPQEIKNHIHSC